ncbi:hypothetical protein ANN_07897 [Periplaneta americana]|uniref:Uncharacterized protein n=1 Tax=Periplaneta americana TaxID=6978 RepID=A0ABQ8SZY5_PERAM|nr:hypothetical protein ANN_07897 [Periplaneta americana]
MAGLSEGGNEPPGSLKASNKKKTHLSVSKQFTFLALLVLPYVSNQSDSLMAADGDCRHLCTLMAPVRHRWSINDVIGGIRNTTVMPSDCSPPVKGLDRPAGCWTHAHMSKQKWTIIQSEWRYRVISTMIPPTVIAGIRNRISLPIVAPEVRHDAGWEPEGSLPPSHKPASGPYPEQD